MASVMTVIDWFLILPFLLFSVRLLVGNAVW